MIGTWWMALLSQFPGSSHNTSRLRLPLTRKPNTGCTPPPGRTRLGRGQGTFPRAGRQAPGGTRREAGPVQRCPACGWLLLSRLRLAGPSSGLVVGGALPEALPGLLQDRASCRVGSSSPSALRKGGRGPEHRPGLPVPGREPVRVCCHLAPLVWSHVPDQVCCWGRQTQVCPALRPPWPHLGRGHRPSLLFLLRGEGRMPAPGLGASWGHWLFTHGEHGPASPRGGEEDEGGPAGPRAAARGRLARLVQAAVWG